ncbi:NAD-glutamate dehydrogenase [Phenylobacterium terrae]|uniref:NAD-glutamate dehydrogenase n=1 Tax=Phenylobacterium terrae TaxID=2665495 RepID=A0ABW4N0J3_9CAUL
MSARKGRVSAQFHQDLLAAFRARAGADAAAEAFIAQASEDAVPEELPELSPAVLAETLADFWRFGSGRLPGEPLIRLAPISGAPGLERLEIVQPDSPFLVDSVMGEVAEQGIAVRAMFHPVVDMPKGPRRSMIQVVLEQVGADREARLVAGLRQTLADVRSAVADFPAMLALMDETIRARETIGPANAAREEELAFLRWLHAQHFVFLGARVYEYPRDRDGSFAPEQPRFDPAASLGVLRDPDRVVLRRSSEPAVLAASLKRRLADPAVTVAKANLRSRVHRRAYMDYVAVKRWDEAGQPFGEIRFVGLFTAEAYDKPAAEVPLVRAKVARVLKRAGKAPGSHSGNRLRNILENHPRDELFQSSEDELLRIAEGVLHLADRPRVRLFERRDPFERFASLLLYVPRDRYNSSVRERAGELLAQAYSGRVSAYYPNFSEGALARVHFILGFSPDVRRRPDLAELERQIAEIARTWEDRFEAAVRTADWPTEQVADTLARCEGAFPAGYRERYDAVEALADLAVIGSMGEAPVKVRAFRQPTDTATQLRFKLYRPGAPAPLADVLPILEHMGLKAMFEAGHPVTLAGREPVWVHEFELDDERGEHLVFAEVKAAFEEAFVAVWTGETENDGFNRLVLELSISWREAALVRALARYRQQSGLDPTEPVQARALSEHPGVTRLILDLFRTRFDPAIRAEPQVRREQARAVMAEIEAALQRVPSLDDDRVLRRLALLVGAIQRTNFYQLDEAGRPKPYISFKVASGELADLPAPKPYREIFVWATHVEGVHLRFGPVARGGLRWSDRRDDFRTEVLGLAKAQQVKNAVIVPVGSKGGFFPKQLPKGGAPDAVRAEGVRAYKTFLNGLLDLTDNLTPRGEVVHPPGAVVHDGDDPYLVVAADKGTATFSDIANGIAEERGFWLGDAFASGGSAGYDHKAMGITARGAWEAVKRHFRELGKDIQSEPFTVIGVGDMSGDVFGNGMLLSRQTRLLAAFDHRHIFLDPDPDPATSYAERERLFALPRSSWDDYDRGAISAGGGVFPRSQKSIPLSKEVRALLGVEAEALAPDELMRAILKAPAELLYLGGIGTYVKAAFESHADVGDKANDAIRVNGADLRCLVVGEGANLGFTQAARVEFARAGGRIDTDAIHNSGGVDSSDHEVNIKILTGVLERTGVLKRRARDRLLRSMTDELAQHVLQHNYDQTLALSLLELDSAGELGPHARFMAELEAQGRLDRALEGLPDAFAVQELQRAGKGLTRPELAVLLAYGKLELSRSLAACGALSEPEFEQVLEHYFPKPLRRYRQQLRRHRLRREIIATVLANDVVNRCGPTFASRLMAGAGADVDAFIRGHQAARAVLDLDGLWAETAALDGAVSSGAQLALFRELAAALRGQTFWLARRAARRGASIKDLVARYAAPVRALRQLMPEVLSPHERAGVLAAADRLTAAGAPAGLAQTIALTRALTTAADLVDLAAASRWPLANAARAYHGVGALFGFDRVRAAAGEHAAGDPFERTAVRRLLEDLLASQAAVAGEVMAFAGRPAAGESAGAAQVAAEAWCASRGPVAEAAQRTLAEIEAAGGGWTFAKLTIAHAALRELASGAPKARGLARRR